MWIKESIMEEEAKQESIADLVNDFLANTSHSEEDCMLVYALYTLLLDTSVETAGLEMENSLLERRLEIAENAVKRLEKEAKECKYTA